MTSAISEALYRAQHSAGRIYAACLVATAVVIAWGGAAAQPAYAYEHINTFSVTPTSTQAGGHPDVALNATYDNRFFNVGGAPPPPPGNCDCQDVEQVTNEFPTGFIGNPHAIPECTLVEFSSLTCPPESQVGIASVFEGGEAPLYNLEPHPGQPGLTGVSAPLIASPIFIELYGRTNSDYGLNTRSVGIFHLLPITALHFVLWGVPGDPSHDANRFPSPQPGGFGCFATYPEPCGPPVPFNGAVKPYLENPTSCDTPLSAGLELLYYDFGRLHASAPWPSTTGCDLLSFDPSLVAKPTTTQAETPTGLDVDLDVPQTQSPTSPSPSEIRAVTVTLPRGFSINPDAADGKAACDDAEANFDTLLEAQCPEHAKVGTLSLDSTALPAPIDGAVYLGQPLPGDRYRLILAADGFSTHVKLAGTVRPDPKTGQLIVSFENLPQSPFQEFNMHFFGSERGLLATPSQCGSYSVSTEFVPWDGVLPNHRSVSNFTIDSGPGGSACPSSPRSFEPQMQAGVQDNTAGTHTSFGFDLSRSDGEQNLTNLSVTTPPGFTATLKGIPYCSEAALAQLASPAYSGLAELAAPACPVASQIGTAVAGTGAGTHPLYTSGKVYLAGPYKGAPLSLEVVLPAVSGPYDLGNVAVRAAIEVNPLTAQVTTLSDPLPQILEGIPLRTRSIQVRLDRPGFVLNPTDCEPFAVESTVSASEGGLAKLSDPFQIANCGDLPFSPKLKLRLTGGLNRLGHPAIHAVVSTKPGEANSSSIAVTLPPNELLDNAHFNSVCTNVEFAARNCPSGAAIGHAEVTSPLLDQPLSGNAYLRSSGQGLPDLALDLYGQLHIVAVARIDSINGGLRTTFRTIPDVPLGTVALDLQGGSKGLIQNSEGLCGAHLRATVAMQAQSGRRFNHKVALRPACGKQARPGGHRKSHLQRAKVVG